MRLYSLKIFCTLLAALFWTSSSALIAESPNAEIKIDKRAIHPRFREQAIPRDGKVVRNNPPILLWPLTNGKNIHYSFRLSQDPLFKESSTIQGNNLPYAIFNVHHTLALGEWHWQYKAGHESWSRRQSFRITEETTEFETPTPHELTNTGKRNRMRAGNRTRTDRG